MKTMNDYTLYCTPEQTERAYKLGAPIRTFECDNKIARESFIKRFDAIELEGIVMGDIPTTQQMLGWLREVMNIYIDISRYDSNLFIFHDYTNESDENGYAFRFISAFDGIKCKSYKSAELAAIDAALDYLEKGEIK